MLLLRSQMCLLAKVLVVLWLNLIWIFEMQSQLFVFEYYYAVREIDVSPFTFGTAVSEKLVHDIRKPRAIMLEKPTPLPLPPKIPTQG